MMTAPAQKGGMALHSGGNGSGYDGKLFVHLVTQLCADGKAFDAAIETRSAKQSFLVREDCRDLDLTEQREVEVEFQSTSPWIIKYEGRFYVEKLVLLGETSSNSAKDIVSSGSLWNIHTGQLKADISYVARFDHNGEKLWGWSHPWINEAADQVLILANGDSILTASYKTAGSSTFSTWFVRLNRRGDLIWSKRLSVADKSLQVLDVAEDLQGNIWLGGHLGEGTASRAFVMKVNGNGQHLYSRVFGEEPASLSTLIVQNGSVYVSGQSGENSYIAKLTTNESFEWSRNFKGFKRVNLTVTDSGNAVFQAYFTAKPDGIPVFLPHLRLIALNAAGEISKTLTFDSDIWQFIFPERFLKASDSSLWMSRYHDGTKKLQLLKFDQNLNFVTSKALGLDAQLSGGRLIQDGGGLSIRSSIMGLPPYSTDVFTWFDPESCSRCEDFSAPPVIATEAPTIEDGPNISEPSSIAVEDVDYGSWVEAVVFLPLVSF